VKFFSSKRRIAAAAVLILLILFLVRPGVSRLKARIASSISRAVDRPVEIGSVHLRFLPRPGFDLENLVIYENPAFGAEPMLRAPEVTAVVRLTSLMRGRMDIARLELTEPSLNLVRRNEDGRWNWTSLLERTARTPLAPTAKSKTEARPGFPYIEASSGRINFKLGAEKKPYALLNADFALWQESENGWGVRLRAEPLRTDMSLSDTGLLRINGTWQRAASLFETPLQFNAEWDRAQLGQLTKLVSGADKGWRGDARLEMTLSGTPAALRVAADGSIRDFRRYDISTSDGLALAAHCDGKYNSAEGMMREIFCSGPVGNGVISLHGDAGRPGVHSLNLTLNMENVPANSVAQLVRRAKKDLPADLVATGNVRGNFSIREDGASRPEVEGTGELTAFHLQSAGDKVEFAPGRVPFVLTSEGDGAHDSWRMRPERGANVESWKIPDELGVRYGPFPVALGRPVAAQARGWLGRSGYEVMVRGEGEVGQTLRLAGLFGLPAVKANVEGVAQLDLQIVGVWRGNEAGPSSNFSLPKITGTAQLHNVRVTAKGLNEPVEIVSSELKLSPDEARLDKLNARAAEAHWTGSVTLPRGCGTPGACVARFSLNSDEMEMGELSAWLGSNPKERRWYQVFTPSEPSTPSFLLNLRASGNVNVTRLLAHNLTASRVSAGIDLDRGKLNVTNLNFDLLGGKHRGDWQADFTGAIPVYKGSGTVTNVSLDQAADAMHDEWISGNATGTYELAGRGKSSTAFWQSAEGEVHFDLRDAELTHVSLLGDGAPLRIVRWRGAGRLHDGKLEIHSDDVVSPANLYEISGTASLGRSLNLKLISGSADSASGAGSIAYSITGTLAQPHVVQTPAPETQAKLKP